MSWLYTIVFAGLIFSSNNTDATDKGPAVQTESIPVATATGDETERFEQTYPLTANGKVSLENVNGSIVVEAWDRNEVKLEYVKTSDTKERLADIEVKIDSRPDSFNVQTDYSNWKSNKGTDGWKFNGKLQVDYHLTVPRGAVLNEIETVNGSVTVSNFTNVTKVSAVNGAVNASNLRGTANLSTVNGEVLADFDRLEPGSTIILSTVNGHVNLMMPSDSNATVNADSLNGNITNDFGLPVRKGKYIGRDLYGRIGSGDVRIKLDSVNGGLSISRKNDGKSLSPAVNLLPQKEKDDEDWDKDDDKDKSDKDKAASKAPKVNKINKEVEKAVSESQIAVADAERQVIKIRPEVERITAESVARAAEAIERSAQILSSTDYQEKIKEAQAKQMDILTKMSSDTAFASFVPRVEQKSETFPVTGIPKVTVEAKGCSVSVRGWDRPEVQYRVTQFSDPRGKTPLKLTEDHNATSVTLKLDNPDVDARNGNFSNDATRVRIEVFVPRKSNLKISSNGAIRLEGVSGDVDLSGADESINVRDVDGTLRVLNADGRIRVVGFSGAMDARTADGDVYLEGDFKSLNGKAVDGRFILTVPSDPDLDIEANIETISVENLHAPNKMSGDIWRFGRGGTKYHFSVNDGSLLVRAADIVPAI